MSKQNRRKTAADRYAEHYEDGYRFGRKEMVYDVAELLHKRVRAMNRKGRIRDAQVGLEFVKYILDHIPQGQTAQELFPEPVAKEPDTKEVKDGE